MAQFDLGPSFQREHSNCYFSVSLILLQVWHSGSRKEEKRSLSSHCRHNIFSEVASASVL